MNRKHGTKRHPRHQQRADDRGDPRVEGAGVAVGADERDELHHHDQGAGGVSASASPRTISPGASQWNTSTARCAT